MTPFGEFLEGLRRSRNLRQKQLASMVGIDPCYVSALENGRRPPPSKAIISNLVKNLKLSDEEQKQLKESIDKSAFVIRAPTGMSKEEYVLIFELNQRLGALSKAKVTVLLNVLRLSE